MKVTNYSYLPKLLCPKLCPITSHIYLEGLGEGSTTGHTRKLLSRAREELRLEVFSRAISLHPNQQGRGVSSWKERDKLTRCVLITTCNHIGVNNT